MEREGERKRERHAFKKTPLNRSCTHRHKSMAEKKSIHVSTA